VDDMHDGELRNEVRQLRHDSELLRIRAAIESRERLQAWISTLETDCSKELEWTSDRLHRHVSAARDPSLHSAVQGEAQQQAQRMVRKFHLARRQVRGQLLPHSPAVPPMATANTALSETQMVWLRSCCAVLFPRCLICVFNPQAQDDAKHSPWSILSEQLDVSEELKRISSPSPPPDLTGSPAPALVLSNGALTSLWRVPSS